jgi:glyoxylase I family protein
LENPVRIRLNSIPVEGQSAALTFYTEVLGFQLKHDIDMGGPRWLTVVSPEDPHGAELVLEPNTNPASQMYQSSLREQGIPITAFEVDDVAVEHERLAAGGVQFTMEPTDVGAAVVAVLDDTCGNLIQIYQPK